jgi:predicted  nucleic acid-binding Zn-ribbon protein
MITKEWLEEEIAKLEKELAEASGRLADTNYRLEKAKKEFDAAREFVETTEGCIGGLRDELEYLVWKEQNDADN